MKILMFVTLGNRQIQICSDENNEFYIFVNEYPTGKMLAKIECQNIESVKEHYEMLSNLVKRMPDKGENWKAYETVQEFLNEMDVEIFLQILPTLSWRVDSSFRYTKSDPKMARFTAFSWFPFDWEFAYKRNGLVYHIEGDSVSVVVPIWYYEK